MNFNYVINTGALTITGCRVGLEDRNYFANLASEFVFDSLVVTGRHESRVSYNSQTLLEQDPVIVSGVNQTFYSLSSGDYYINIEQINQKGKIFLNEDLVEQDVDVLMYDPKDYYTGVYTGYAPSSPLETLSGIISKLADRGELSPTATISELFTGWDVYMNGQKTPSYEEFTGINQQITGRAFALRKEFTKEHYNSELPDTKNSKYIDFQVDYYCNGMEQPPSLFLQLYSGVNMIGSGVAAIDFIGDTESTNYSL